MEYNGYKMFTVRGRPKFRKIGERGLMKQNALPRDVMDHFGLLGDESPEEPKKNPKACIFCGMHSRYTRFVNGQTVYICDEHYYSENIGKIVQKLRELNHEKEDSKENKDSDQEENAKREDEVLASV